MKLSFVGPLHRNYSNVIVTLPMVTLAMVTLVMSL